MEREQIIRMAREAGASQLQDEYHALFGDDAIERFAALVAAAEREACAKVCDRHQFADIAAAAIRARGEK